MYDVAIIGCGVVGAAAAYSLCQNNVSCIIIEKQNDVACGTTRANSAILHAGYDPHEGTLMAKLNVRGSVLAKEICKKLDVPYKQIGSLVLAFSDEEMSTVQELYNRGINNGVKDMQILDALQVKQIEKGVSDKVVGALYAPTAAIVNPWELCLAMAENAVLNGAELLLNTEITSIKAIDGGWQLASGKKTIQAKYVLNAAGNYSDKIHNMVAEKSFEIVPTRGQYYLLDKCEGSRASHVLFQCPNKNGKGVLVAPTVHGNLIVGPSAEPANSQYDVVTTTQGLNDVRSKAVKSVPGIDFRQSIRNFAGVRANSDCDDFIIGEAKGAKGFFDLAGIRSPGLTAAPAIGEMAVEMLKAAGLDITPKQNKTETRKRLRINELPPKEKAEAIKKNPSYGRVICRCETITEGEITDTFNTPIPPVSIDGIKRRVGAGMGRCQGGFCGPRVLELLSKALNLPPQQILQDCNGSYILTGETKAQKED